MGLKTFFRTIKILIRTVYMCHQFTRAESGDYKNERQRDEPAARERSEWGWRLASASTTSRGSVRPTTIQLLLLLKFVAIGSFGSNQGGQGAGRPQPFPAGGEGAAGPPIARRRRKKYVGSI